MAVYLKLKINYIICSRRKKWEIQYYYSFVEAYFETYPGHEYEKIKKNHKSHILDTYHNLRYYEDLEKDELSKLITFCVTLGSYVSSEEVDEIRNQGPCFR